MALTLPRWLALVALAGGAISVALLPPPPRDVSRRFSPSAPNRVQRLESQLKQARERLEISRLEETVNEEISRGRIPAGAVTILGLAGVPAGLQAAYSEEIREWWPKTGLDSSIAVGIVMSGDSVNDLWQSLYLLPAVTGGNTCVTVVPTYSWSHVQRRSKEENQMRFATELGPCLFFGMFGRPGPAVERWIGGRGLDFATYFNPAVQTAVKPRTFGGEPDGVLYLLFEMEWSVYGTMPLGIMCLNNEIEQCKAALGGTDTARPISPGFRKAAPPWRGSFGSLTGSYLADLHRAIGPERFRSFWSSNRPLDEAFHEATGTDMGAWTHQWAVGRRAVFRPGPLPRDRSVARATGLTVLLLGIAMVFGIRRTVLR